MKKLFSLILVALVATFTFTSCEDEDYATEIAGTYVGYSDLKIRTTTQVVLAYEKENSVTVTYDTDMDKAPTSPVSAKVKKSGDVYTFSGSKGVESFNGTVDGKKLTLKVYINSSLIYDITAEKQ